MSTLNESFEQYRNGTMSWELFVNRCIYFIQKTVTTYGKTPIGESEEVVGDFYPYLQRLCERYTDQGASFEAYLNVSLRYYCLTRYRKRRRHMYREVLIGDIQSGLFVTESVPLSPGEECSGHESVLNPLIFDTRTRDALRKQILISFCKNLPLFERDEARRYAEIFGIPVSFVESLEAYLMDRRQKYLTQRTEFQDQLDRHYGKMRNYTTLAMLEANPRKNRVYLEKSDYHRGRWMYYLERLQRQNVHLSNREVGILLGIPKGSVDSALSNLGRRLEGYMKRR